MLQFYTGIGSRETPSDVLRLMTAMAQRFAAQGLVLRSGGADGADSAFEAGAGTLAEIYLPWPDFNRNRSNRCSVSAAALALAETVHPAWFRLSPGAQKLHGRNCYQLLGAGLDLPSSFVICWHNDSGGTMTAVRLAERHSIPVHNLRDAATLARACRFLG